MNETGMEDKNGRLIRIGDIVLLDGSEFEVIVNSFTKRIVIDGDTGQAALDDVHFNCVVKRKGDDFMKIDKAKEEEIIEYQKELWSVAEAFFVRNNAQDEALSEIRGIHKTLSILGIHIEGVNKFE